MKKRTSFLSFLVFFYFCFFLISLESSLTQGTSPAINEFLVDSEKGLKDWVEIYSPSPSLSLENWKLVDEKGNTVLFTAADKFSPAGFLVKEFNKLNIAADKIILIDDTGAEIDSLSYPGNVPKPGPDESTGRYPDGEDAWYTFLTTTPGEKNFVFFENLSAEKTEVFNDEELKLAVTFSKNIKEKTISEIIDETAISLVIDKNNNGLLEIDQDWVKEKEALSCTSDEEKISCFYLLGPEELKLFDKEKEYLWTYFTKDLLEGSGKWIYLKDKSFVIKNRPPELVNPDYQKERFAVEGVPLAEDWDADLKFIDKDNDPLSYSWKNNPFDLLIVNDQGEITWEEPSQGKYSSIKLIAEDPFGGKAEAIFNLTVKPFLEITQVKIQKEGEETSLEIKKGEIVPWSSLQLQPGSKFYLTVEVTNNGNYDVKDVHLTLKGFGLFLEDKNIGLLEKEGGSQQYTFQGEVPNVADPEGEYEIEIIASSEEVFVKKKEDFFTFQVKVKKIVGEVRINQVTWEQDKKETYCDQWLGLNLEVENIGVEPKEIKIYLQNDDPEETLLAVSSSQNLAPGDKTTFSLKFNTLNLTEEEHQLTLVLVNGWEDIEDLKIETWEKHGCFETKTPLIEIYEGEERIFELTDYLNTQIEEAEKDKIHFLPNNLITEPAIVSCIWVDQTLGRIKCTAPADEKGLAVLKVNLALNSLLFPDQNTENTAEINLQIKPTLEITEISLKETLIKKEGISPPLFPEEEYLVKFKITNQFNEELTNLHVVLQDSGQGLFCGDNQNKVILNSLAPGETSEEIVLKEVLCSSAKEGLFEDVKLVVWGLDKNTQVKDFSFPFKLKVVQAPTQIKLETSWEEEETYCDQWLRLKLNYENLGDASSFTPIKLSLVDEKGLVLFEQTDLPAPGEEILLDFSTEMLDKSEEPHLLTINLAYEATIDDYLDKGTVEKTLSVLKHGCPLEVVDFENLFEGEPGKTISLLDKINIPDEEKEKISSLEIIQTDKEKEIALCELEDKDNDGLSESLTCIPQNNHPGEFDLKVKITAEAEAIFEDKVTFNEEEIKINVKPTLTISKVEIDGEEVKEGADSKALAPLTEFFIKITLTNHWSKPLTFVKVKFSDTENLEGLKGQEFVFTDLNIAPTEDLLLEIPLTLTTLKSVKDKVTLIVEAKDEDNYPLGDFYFDDEFTFFLKIAQSPVSQIKITQAQLIDTSETYCNQVLKLALDYVNSGLTEATNVRLIIKEGDLILKEETLVDKLEASTSKSDFLLFNTTKLSQGEEPHFLTLLLVYEITSGEEKTFVYSEPLLVTKHGCLDLPEELILTEDNSSLVLNLTSYLLNEKEKTSLLFSLEQTNPDLINCQIEKEYFLVCKWPPVPSENSIAQALKEGETKINKITLKIKAKDQTENEELVSVVVEGINDPPQIKENLKLGPFDEGTYEIFGYYETAVDSVVIDVDNELTELNFVEDSALIKSLEITETGKLRIYLEEEFSDWYGQETFTLTVSDGYAETSEKVTLLVKWNQSDDKATLEKETPLEETLVVSLQDSLKLKIKLLDPDQANPEIKWYVEEEDQKRNQTEFNFKPLQEGTYQIKAVIYEGTPAESKVTWTLIVKNLPSELVVPEAITLDGDPGTFVKKTFEVKNTGNTAELKDIQLSFVGPEKYQVKFYDPLSETEIELFDLEKLETKAIKIVLFIPEDEKGGEKEIGKINFVYSLPEQEQEITKTSSLSLQVKNLFEITSFELNGKEEGEFKPGEKNKIEIELKNKHQKELEEITIEIEIEDLDDGEDYEDNKEIDLGAGEEETIIFKFKVPSSVDEEEYLVRVWVEGDLLFKKEFSVKREKHHLVLKEIVLPEVISCNRYPSLFVTLENQGKSDEESVVLKIKSEELNIEQEKTSLSLDSFFGSNPEYHTSFSLDLSQVKEGTYPLQIFLYRDEDQLEDTKTISLTVKECSLTYQKEKETPLYSLEGVVQQIQKEMESLSSSFSPPPSPPEIKVSFRETKTYLGFLIALVVLLFLAIILGTALIFKKK